MFTDATFCPVSIENSRILIVDDNAANVKLLERVLEGEGFTRVLGTTDPGAALRLFEEFRPDAILLDWHMPCCNGETMLTTLLGKMQQGRMPVVVITADVSFSVQKAALEAGATDFLAKPFEPTEVVLRVRNLLAMRCSYLRLQRKEQLRQFQARGQNRKLEQAYEQILWQLAVNAERRAGVDDEHMYRVGRLAAKLAAELKLSPKETELIERAAPLHDIGNVAVLDRILQKPGPLDATEAKLMQAHTTEGAHLLADTVSEMTSLAATIVLTHHECWDGTGYPYKLQGETIPLAGRIVAVADAFDAVTHVRPYRKALTFHEAVSTIDQQSGKRFDPAIVEAFFKVLENNPSIASSYISDQILHTTVVLN